MGLIAFLTAAIVVILPRVANTSKIAATRATIKKVDELLNDRMNGFKRWIQTQDQIAGGGIPSYVDSGTFSEAGNNLALAKVLATKKRFRENFCQTYSELPLTITSSNPQGPTHQLTTDSAECLYLILTKGALFDTEPPSATDLKGLEIADTDKDGLFEIVDGWGNPLRFYRWPTRLIRAAVASTSPPPLIPPQTVNSGGPGYGIAIQPQYPPSAPVSGLSARLLISSVTIPASFANTFAAELSQPLAKDPDDPAGLIDAWSNGPQSSSANATAFEQNYHTPDTFYTPLIVSMGPDAQLGLFEPSEPSGTTNFGRLCQPRTDLSSTDPAGVSALYDNITNRQQ